MEFDFNTLAGGAVAEQAGRELQKIFENLCDPNAKGVKRKLVITMTFTPDKVDQDLVATEIDVKSTLAPVSGVSTRFLLGVGSNGKVEGSEWAAEMRGQMNMEELEQEKVIDLQRSIGR